MIKNQPKIKYFLYARKSSESEDRQVQSIEDQVNRLTKLAKEQGLVIQEIITEAKSAKKPNNRPKFDEMIKMVENGGTAGILCWQINRLSRNPIDSAKLQWLLQNGVLKSIQTVDREYRPEDNVLVFSVESGMANQFLLDLSKNVKRGIQGKLEKGWLPGSAPTGYLNDVIEHTILADPERFPLIRQAWDLMLTGNYSVAQILDTLNNDWGFRTVKKKRSGGKPLALSGLYSIFSNLFYTGVILHLGEQYPAQHPSMVTLDEFDRVQIILGRKGKPRPKTHEFAYTGVIRCGDCGCMITAQSKTKNIKSDGSLKTYTYYHCTKRKVNVPCSQKGAVKEENLEEQIEKQIASLTILPEFKQWALDCLNENNDQEIDNRSKVYESQHKTLTETQAQLDSLTKMRYRELIDDETFLKEKQILTYQIARLTSQLRETEGRAEKWLELTEKTFDFACYAHSRFLTGDLRTKKEILSALGSNFVLKDGKLTLSLHKYFEPIIQQYPSIEKEYKRLELNKTLSNKAKTAALTTVFTRWQGR